MATQKNFYDPNNPNPQPQQPPPNSFVQSLAENRANQYGVNQAMTIPKTASAYGVKSPTAPTPENYSVASAYGVKTPPPSQTAGPTPETDEQRTARIQKEQQQASAQYQENLPYYQQKMGENLSQQANQGMYQGMQNIESRNASRGMGYGGLNEGMKEQQRAQSQQGLASSISSANKGLLDLGQQLQTGAINTGLGIQSDLQNRQNLIYQQALQQQQSQNQMMGSYLGLLGQGAMLYALSYTH